MSELAQQLINGLSSGSQYALWAVGYGLVFQVLGLMHFAHGDTLLLGLYIAFAFMVTMAMPAVVAIVLVLIIGAILAMIVERGVYRPLVKRGNLMAAFSAALGAAYIMRNIVTLGWTHETKVFPSIITDSNIEIAGTVLPTMSLIALVVTLAVVALFTAFLRHQRWGRAIIVLAQDRSTAALMDIPVFKVVTLVYALSGAIGMVGALLYVGQFGALDPLVGISITLKAFVAALLGGLGRIGGALLGGLLLGLSEALVVGYVTSLYSDAVVFAILAAVLLIRPQGLLGRRELVKP